MLWTERWLDAFVEGGWGRVNLGQGSGAADDVSTLDLSGTNMPNGTCPTDWGGAIPFRTSAGASLGVGRGQRGLGNCNDFESRYDRVMYTTPTFGGFRAQVSTGQKDNNGEADEASVWYSGKLAGDFQAAIGYSNVNTGTGGRRARPRDDRRFGVAGCTPPASTSRLTRPQVEGISGSATDGRKGRPHGFKVGYKFGTHAVCAGLRHLRRPGAAGDEGDVDRHRLRVEPGPLGRVLCRLPPVHAGSSELVSLEDITVFVIGTRIRF